MFLWSDATNHLPLVTCEKSLLKSSSNFWKTLKIKCKFNPSGTLPKWWQTSERRGCKTHLNFHQVQRKQEAERAQEKPEQVCTCRDSATLWHQNTEPKSQFVKKKLFFWRRAQGPGEENENSTAGSWAGPTPGLRSLGITLDPYSFNTGCSQGD